MSAPGPRIAPGGRRQIGLLNTAVVRVAGAVIGRPVPNVFTTLARHPGLFRRWLVFAGGLMPGGKLLREETELAILRVAHNTDCAYEWDHHERIGRRAGLTAAEIERVRNEATGGADWSGRKRLVLRAADALHADGVIGDALWAELAAAFDERELIELCLLIGHYEMLAMTLNTLRVQLDPPPRGQAAGAHARGGRRRSSLT
ncbi:carboxymuconolactone decarboxylase family protein [Conexibacter sp. JD483]|uniref:carboxymuconolactone decarboxylase family protein n=1 Tax=unclassified Conexibacter TaxID=2627773 RepID=UPI0027271A75|nr:MULTISPECIES: carboxymuconolactone decarboxylase family protein [unclassified Conexibacter]MDO8184764.1 carboxymuconolactone decarboxylase family protein [Conexibacter sp. CPCC 205706]MDO8196539.1 carboxymuconolactone decarboxylase family protein [Conexibacter sp. CPCC 205762]MDR9369025.1 carboxymuconolactone decarboxylase family protein [Conexibacter sp. JD483]